MPQNTHTGYVDTHSGINLAIRIITVQCTQAEEDQVEVQDSYHHSRGYYVFSYIC